MLAFFFFFFFFCMDFNWFDFKFTKQCTQLHIKMHSYHDQVFAKAVQQKERLGGTIKYVRLCTYASYLEGLDFTGGENL